MRFPTRLDPFLYRDFAENSEDSVVPRYKPKSPLSRSRDLQYAKYPLQLHLQFQVQERLPIGGRLTLITVRITVRNFNKRNEAAISYTWFWTKNIENICFYVFYSLKGQEVDRVGYKNCGDYSE